MKIFSDDLDEILGSKRPTRTSKTLGRRPEEFEDLKKLLLDIQLEMKTNKEELEAKLVNLEDSVTKLRRCNQNPLRVKISDFFSEKIIILFETDGDGSPV